MSLQTINTPRDSTLKTTEQTPRNIADVLADELSGIAQALGGSTDYDDLSHRPQINSVTLTGDKSADDLSLAMQGDLTSIKAVGSTNATGSTITKGTYFYLNGKLCLAKSDIANGATFTLNTNYEVVTAGGLNSLNSAFVKTTQSMSTSILVAPLGYVANILTLNVPTGYELVGYDIKTYGAYGTYCTFYVDNANNVSATNLHPTASASVIIDIKCLWKRI